MMTTSKTQNAAASTSKTTIDWREDFVHTGPDTLAGRYLRMFWHPVCRSDDLASGRTKPIRILGEDFTLYRGEGGTPHIVAFRCAHRGTQLSAGWVQGDDLRCYYHGWKYDASGQCIEQPAEREPFCQKVRIRSCPTQEYIGLIFGFFGEGEPPALPRFPEVEDAPGLLENWFEEWPCNYFNRLENAGDNAHVPFVHYNRLREKAGEDAHVPFVHYRSSDIPLDLEATETEYGFQMTRPGGRQEEAGAFHMPNMNLLHLGPKARDLEKGRRKAVMWRVPVDDENHLVLGAQRVQVFGEDVEAYLIRRREADRKAEEEPMVEVARKVLAGEVTADYIVKTRWWDISSVQDMLSLGVGQGVVAPREREQLGRSDVGVIMLRKIYMRELRALAQGQPLKEWKHLQG